jgi:hypothetical protein
MPADERGLILQTQMQGLREDVKNHGPFLSAQKKRESQGSFYYFSWCQCFLMVVTHCSFWVAEVFFCGLKLLLYEASQ